MIPESLNPESQWGLRLWVLQDYSEERSSSQTSGKAPSWLGCAPRLIAQGASRMPVSQSLLEGVWLHPFPAASWERCSNQPASCTDHSSALGHWWVLTNASLPGDANNKESSLDGHKDLKGGQVYNVREKPPVNPLGRVESTCNSILKESNIMINESYHRDAKMTQHPQTNQRDLPH